MPKKIDFRVIHASGQDEQCRAVELNTHSLNTKGWQSSRYCLYPQDIVVQLKSRTRLRKVQLLSHQCLIATKIEIYVGDVAPGITPTLSQAKYTRLGYVALSDNERSSFKARELKSVQVDALGQFVKFVIHKNHVNKHNLYNQVGVIAVNVIGDDISDPLDDLDDPKKPTSDPSLAAIFRPDYISPLDDLAFDMYQDPECAHLIRKLDAKKRKAVAAEKYDYANKLKNIINQLHKAGEKLGKYEVEKRQAVESEDYDKAQLKKTQIDEYRTQVYAQLQIATILDSHELRPTVEQPAPAPLTDRPYSPPVRLRDTDPEPPPTQRAYTPPRTPYDERPLPAIKKQATKPAADSAHLPPATPHDDKPLPGNKKANQPDDDELPTNDQSGNVTGEPEPMSEKDQRLASSVIEVFGLPLVSKAYSKTWSFREDALLEIYRMMSDLQPSTPRDDSKAMFRAAIFLVCKGIKDKVLAVYTAALNLLRMLLTEYITNHRPSKQDISVACDKTVKSLIVKLGDTAVRSRDTAKQFIIEQSQFPEIKPMGVVLHECVKPFKTSVAPRLASSRVELLHQLYDIHKISTNGLTVANMMEFLTVALQHNSGEVREGAERLIIELYRACGRPVKDYLPPDDDRTRRNVLYKQMFEAFDKIDGKPSKKDLKRQQDESDAAKKKQVEALQAELNQLRSMAAGGKPKQEKAADNPPKDTTGNKKKSDSNKKATPAPSAPTHEDDVSTLFPVDKTCIFCGEQNESFTEEGLDIHYWKNCPVLKRCANCKQVVEIVGLTEHLLTECEAKDNYSQCPRCSQAILKTEYDQHLKEKTCNPAEANKQQCPMCHTNIAGGEEEFKAHLMGKDGCKHNPRRLQALNAKQQGPKAGGKGQPKTGRSSKQ